MPKPTARDDPLKVATAGGARLLELSAILLASASSPMAAVAMKVILKALGVAGSLHLDEQRVEKAKRLLQDALRDAEAGKLAKEQIEVVAAAVREAADVRLNLLSAQAIARIMNDEQLEPYLGKQVIRLFSDSSDDQMESISALVRTLALVPAGKERDYLIGVKEQRRLSSPLMPTGDHERGFCVAEAAAYEVEVKGCNAKLVRRVVQLMNHHGLSRDSQDRAYIGQLDPDVVYALVYACSGSRWTPPKVVTMRRRTQSV